MRLGILLLALGATLFGSGFWYDQVNGLCHVPVRYRIGTIDDRFGTNVDEVRRIAREAEAVWEDRLQTNLFEYDENATLPINFVFDERQEQANREAELREDLEAKEGMNDTVASQYQKLIDDFRVQKKRYESEVASYESALKKYNDTVTEWNAKGGAPEEEIAKLRKEEQALQKTYEQVNALSKKLDVIVTELNKIGTKGNALIKDYNSIVETYNTEFSTEREFTQGDFTGDAIDIYQFDSEDELIVVLAHEFGHALDLGHVENEESIMYHLMEKQNVSEGLTSEDIEVYTTVCTKERGVFGFIRALSTRS